MVDPIFELGTDTDGDPQDQMTIRIEDYYYIITLEPQTLDSWDGMNFPRNEFKTVTLSSEPLDGTQVYGPIRTGNIKVGNDRSTI